ncbi:MAG TPA: hypothetical protein VK498_02355 [Ferruginibacter sp.]|nr:hypothetical protein [Ferruginibacter sp.]
MNTLKLILLLLFISLSFQSSATDDDGKIRPRVKRIVEKLQKDHLVHFGYAVGFAGIPETNNKYYKRYEKLKRIATNEELVFLTSSKSKQIVVYSFDILQSRGYKQLREIFIEHVKDTTFFWTAGGCTGLINRVNWFMLGRLASLQISGENSLSKKEYEKYCQQFEAEDKYFKCQ